MKKLALTLTFLTLSSSVFAQSWYRTDRVLAIGDQYEMNHSSCEVKGQLSVGHGSEPLRVDIGRDSCEAVFNSILKDGEGLAVYLNGDTQIINCLVCVQK